MIRNIFLVCISILCISLSCRKTKTFTANEILNKYKKATEESLLVREKSSFKAEMNYSIIMPEGYHPSSDSITDKYFVLNDSNRIDIRTEARYFDDGIITKEFERRYLYDNGIAYKLNHHPEEEPSYMFVLMEGSYIGAIREMAVNANLEGYSTADDKYLWEIFEEAEDLKLRKNMEMIDGHQTYVLEATIPSQCQFTLWIDPAFGYNMRKLVKKRYGTAFADAKPTGGDPSLSPGRSYPQKEVLYTLNTLEFEKIGDVFVPVYAEYDYEVTYTNDEKALYQHTYKRTEIDLNPDFSKYPDAFILDVPDGIPIHYYDYMGTGKRFEWWNSQIVEKENSPTIEESENTK